MRGQLKISLQVFLVVCLLNTAIATTTTISQATESSDSSWQEVKSKHFVIKYKQGYQQSAETVLSHLKVARKKAATFFPDTYDADRRLAVYVYPESKWNRGANSLYWTTSNRIHINVLAPADSPNGEAWYSHGLAHEYANIVMYDYTGDKGRGSYRYHNWAPAWFGEGISEYFAIQVVLEPSQRQEYERQDDVQDLRARIIDGKGYFTVIAQDKYAGGYLIAKYLFATYEKDAIFSILSSKKDYFYDSVYERLHVPRKVFWNGWLKWAETNIGGSYPNSHSVEASQERHQLIDKLSEKNETVNSLQTQLSNKNRTIRYKKIKIRHLENRTETLRKRIERKNQTIESLRKTLAQKNETRTTTQISPTDNSSSGQTSLPGFTIPFGLIGIVLFLFAFRQR